MGLVNGNGPGTLLPACFGVIKPGIAERGQRGDQVTSQVPRAWRGPGSTLDLGLLLTMAMVMRVLMLIAFHKH